MKENSDRHRRNAYVAALDELMGTPAEVCEVGPRRDDLPSITAAVYVDVPSVGFVSGFTYGLSMAEEPAPAPSAREIVMTVRSADTRWALIPATMVSALWGLASFDPRRVVGYAGELVEGSQMAGVLLGEVPNLLEVSQVPVCEDFVTLVGAYPIHRTEREFVDRHGFDALWSLEWDRYDPSRPAVV